jgi:phosphoribosylamine--glycine ligase
MKIIVVGSGAREHAIVRSLRRAGGDREIVAIPGNPGIAREARCVPAQPSLADATLAENPDLVVVGPEAPLAEGFADRMAKERVSCFGPSKAAAQIEASKAFAKEIMHAAGVPTAPARVFEDPAAAREYARSKGACVVKLDGLAAGKGVIVADDGAQAASAVEELWKPGARLLIEDRLAGGEISVIALCDGENVVPLAPAQDYKRILDGDRGPNTGGMGSYSPVPGFDEAAAEELTDSVHRPIVDLLRRRGTPYRGVLYAGLMITETGPKVLEFNCRFGDPETQAVLPRLRSDLLELCLAANRPGGLGGATAKFDDEWAVTVVIASAGYPGSSSKGEVIAGLADAATVEGVEVTHAGTARSNGDVVTAGGRVLNVTGLGATPGEARDRAYEAAGRISFDGMQMRSDIAARAVDRVAAG